MAADVEAVIAALRVALDEAESSDEVNWRVLAANRWVRQLPGSWKGRWKSLMLQGDFNGNVNLTLNNNFTFGYGDNVSELLLDGVGVLPFDAQTVAVGYKDGSPSPTDASYSWGPFEGLFLQQFSSSTSRQFGVYGVSFEYDGTVERRTDQSFFPVPDRDTQWLRRISLTRSFGKTASLAIGLRGINGAGGFGTPGTNLAISYHKRFANLDELYFDYGTPAATQTLDRWIFKYVFHFGGATGT